jgi:hypothetical protein
MAENDGMDADLRELSRSEATRWTEMVESIVAEIPLSLWKGAGPVGRAELLERAHRLMRPAFDLVDDTRVVFAVEVEAGDAAPEGMGFDDERGEYILVAFAELECEDPRPRLAGLAHELRHAFQMQVIRGRKSDPRAEEWVACHRGPERNSETGALEQDASRTQAIVEAALPGTAA